MKKCWISEKLSTTSMLSCTALVHAGVNVVLGITATPLAASFH